MFTKLTALRAGRRHGAALALTHSNIPRPDLAPAIGPPPAGRYVLVCRWVSVPATSKLECRWQIESVAETPAETPGPRQVKGDARHGSAVRLRSKRACLLRAA